MSGTDFFNSIGNNFGGGQPSALNLATAGVGMGTQPMAYANTPTLGQLQSFSQFNGLQSGAGINMPQGQGGGGNWLSQPGNLSSLFGGIQSLGSAYLGFQNLKLAKDNLKFNKQAFNTNLTNSTQDYNTKLEDRINGRTADYAGKQGDVQAYLSSHQLKKPGG